MHDRVRPKRDQNNRLTYREKWWIHGEPRSYFRPALVGLNRYISTVETSKHRFFVFLDTATLPDNKLVNMALDDAYFLGVLSSKVHVQWALACGALLEDRPVYPKTECFDPFPFPAPSDAQRQDIRALGESLDAHRKRQQELHPGLKLTEMYNVLEKLRSGQELDDSERTIHEQAVASVLLEIHNELDAAVLRAYDWPADISTEDLLYRLVALNEQRQAEERRGLIRWLRPNFQQQPEAGQVGLDIEIEEAVSPTARRRPWPESLPERVRAIRNVLAEEPQPIDVHSLARVFRRARRQDVEDIAETLVSLNQARRVANRYTL